MLWIEESNDYKDECKVDGMRRAEEQLLMFTWAPTSPQRTKVLSLRDHEPCWFREVSYSGLHGFTVNVDFSRRAFCQKLSAKYNKALQ